jgi:hypothetical protein
MDFMRVLPTDVWTMLEDFRPEQNGGRCAAAPPKKPAVIPGGRRPNPESSRQIDRAKKFTVIARLDRARKRRGLTSAPE